MKSRYPILWLIVAILSTQTDWSASTLMAAEIAKANNALGHYMKKMLVFTFL
jgi:hypothetical protein